MTQRSFTRQIATVQNLRVPPYFYELTGYEVEEWAGGYVAVTRTYSSEGVKAGWHECLQVGPRGAIKTIYKNFW